MTTPDVFHLQEAARVLGSYGAVAPVSWEAAEKDARAYLEARGVPTKEVAEMRSTVDLIMSEGFVAFLKSEPEGGKGLKAEPYVIARALLIFQSLMEDGLERDPRAVSIRPVDLEERGTWWEILGENGEVLDTFPSEEEARQNSGT